MTATSDNPAKRSSADGVCWDLSMFYSGIDDPQIGEDLTASLERARKFEKRYRGRINGDPVIAAAELAEAAQEYEAILESAATPAIFAMLVHAAKSDVPAHGALVQLTRERNTEVRKHLLFFDLEWIAVPDAAATELLQDPATDRYRHYLEHSRAYKPHRLSEPEEKILEVRDVTGARAFRRLFTEVTSRIVVTVMIDGEEKTESFQETLARLYSPNRDHRKAASDGLTQALREQSHLLTFIFNTLVQDKKSSDELREFATPADERHLDNEIDADTVSALMTACEGRHDIVQRYYRLKQRLLGLDKLYDYDRYAPLSENQADCGWDRCKVIVASAYRDFSPQLGDIVDRFLNENWIDAELRDGKRGGAFSAGTVPTAHPCILLNYTDQIRDVMVAAHELGHGVHQYLAREAGYLQSDTPLTMAETASVFGEMLTFQRLLQENEADPAARLGLLCSKIEDSFATCFRQIVMTRFEEKLHHARRTEGELTADRLGELWIEANRPMHGDSVELTANYATWWQYIPHFVNSPFYCYAYAFGELLVLALFKRYQEEGESFVPKYLDLLSAGGSDSPKNLLAKMGVEVSDPNFWNGGLDLIESLVREAEELAAAQ